ncbi:MAG: hypothetical protein KVP17_002192 [Porospora cf. gigantea B]|uniref:uncharacterized protein n=1 Tax=Porospora cf. gigantea B TaxID=2853592 RepID=UPI003571F20D|nr:MAG: hypothetical protein KVP17_002192 [Porospora cf. gigantea B]
MPRSGNSLLRNGMVDFPPKANPRPDPNSSATESNDFVQSYLRAEPQEAVQVEPSCFPAQSQITASAFPKPSPLIREAGLPTTLLTPSTGDYLSPEGRSGPTFVLAPGGQEEFVEHMEPLRQPRMSSSVSMEMPTDRRVPVTHVEVAETFQYESSAHPYQYEPSTEPYQYESSAQAYQYQPSAETYQYQPSAETYQYEPSAQACQYEPSTEPYQYEASAETYQYEASTEPYQYEASAETYQHGLDADDAEHPFEHLELQPPVEFHCLQMSNSIHRETHSADSHQYDTSVGPSEMLAQELWCPSPMHSRPALVSPSDTPDFGPLGVLGGLCHQAADTDLPKRNESVPATAQLFISPHLGATRPTRLFSEPAAETSHDFVTASAPVAGSALVKDVSSDAVDEMDIVFPLDPVRPEDQSEFSSQENGERRSSEDRKDRVETPLTFHVQQTGSSTFAALGEQFVDGLPPMAKFLAASEFVPMDSMEYPPADGSDSPREPLFDEPSPRAAWNTYDDPSPIAVWNTTYDEQLENTWKHEVYEEVSDTATRQPECMFPMDSLPLNQQLSGSSDYSDAVIFHDDVEDITTFIRENPAGRFMGRADEDSDDFGNVSASNSAGDMSADNVSV